MLEWEKTSLDRQQADEAYRASLNDLAHQVRGLAPAVAPPAHDQLKESPGCTVETHRTLAGKDSWHSHEGYRSGRDMKGIVYHRELGEITRLRCGVQALKVAA